MKTFFLRSSLLALATCALGASSVATNLSEQHEPLDLDKRTFGISLIPLSPCGIFKGGMSGISTYASLSLNLNLGLNARVRCPLTFRCDGSGLDGYQYDINGLPVPSCFPSTWLYFGIERGWQPPASFSCGSSWNVPTAWYPSVHLASWFQPGAGVALSYSSSFNIPSWWLPSTGWSCSGNLGIDGYAFDPYGQGPPPGASGFLYFGVGKGWLPPAGLTIDVNFIFPSGCGALHLATWWSPPFEWVPPPQFGNCPNWWKCKRCHAPTPIVVPPVPCRTTTSASTAAQTTTKSVTPVSDPTTASSSAAASTTDAATSSTAQVTTAQATTSTSATTADAQTTAQPTTTTATAPCGKVTTTSSSSAADVTTAAATTTTTDAQATTTTSASATTTRPTPPCRTSTIRTRHHHSVPTTRRITTSTVRMSTSTSASRPCSTSVSKNLTSTTSKTTTHSSRVAVPTAHPHHPHHPSHGHGHHHSHGHEHEHEHHHHPKSSHPHKHPKHGKGKGKGKGQCTCSLQDDDDDEDSD